MFLSNTLLGAQTRANFDKTHFMKWNDAGFNPSFANSMEIWNALESAFSVNFGITSQILLA